MSAISTQGQFVDNEIARFFRISSLDNWIEWQQQVKTGYEIYKSGYGNGDILLLIKGDSCSNPMPPVVYERKIIPPQDQQRRLKLLKLVHDTVVATAGTWSPKAASANLGIRDAGFSLPSFRRFYSPKSTVWGWRYQYLMMKQEPRAAGPSPVLSVAVFSFVLDNVANRQCRYVCSAPCLCARRRLLVIDPCGTSFLNLP